MLWHSRGSASALNNNFPVEFERHGICHGYYSAVRIVSIVSELRFLSAQLFLTLSSTEHIRIDNRIPNNYIILSISFLLSLSFARSRRINSLILSYDEALGSFFGKKKYFVLFSFYDFREVTWRTHKEKNISRICK